MSVLHTAVSGTALHAQFGRYVAYQPQVVLTQQSGIPSDISDATVWASGRYASMFSTPGEYVYVDGGTITTSE